MKTAHTAELALDMVKSEQPDLILMDINLPGMDGIAALKILRSASSTEKLPVIALSAAAMPKEIELGIEAGFDEYLTKPINVPQVMSAIGKYLA